MNNNVIEDRRKNLEFTIAFSETNLRWLASTTNPSPEHVALNERAIEQAKRELAKLQASNIP